jgi:hypothetical protein
MEQVDNTPRDSPQTSDLTDGTILRNPEVPLPVFLPCPMRVNFLNTYRPMLYFVVAN